MKNVTFVRIQAILCCHVIGEGNNIGFLARQLACRLRWMGRIFDAGRYSLPRVFSVPLGNAIRRQGILNVPEFSSEDRQAVCDMFTRLLEDHASEEQLRELIATEGGFDALLWAKLAELGLTGILVPAEQGGAGGSLVEVEALMEVAGSFLLSGPFIESCVIAPSLLASCNDTSLAAESQKKIASGESVFAVAGCGSSGDWREAPEVNATLKQDGWQLDGEAHFVSYAHVAQECLVYANTPEGVNVFVVAMSDPDVEVVVHKSNDQTQRFSTLILKGAVASILPGVDSRARSSAFNAALVALAGQQVGGSQRMFALTVDYLKTRYQFGQPIGRFQALKHMAADLMVELESATSVARHAAQTLANETEDAETFAYLAGFTCADNYRKITADAIQLHGGIAYTVEHAAHLYWRRAQSGQWAYCASDKLRDLYLTELEKTL